MQKNGTGLKTFRDMALYITSNLMNRIEVFSHAFDVDIVYCYADNNDPERLRQRQSLISETVFENALAKEAVIQRRFNDYGEFRYSLRSVVKFAPWFRNLYIITSTPNIAWLRPGGDGHEVFIIPDERLFPSKEYLPNFNSGSLETLFDKIPGLSEHFIYFNDDTFLGNYVTKNTFFTPDGRCRINQIGELPTPHFSNPPIDLHKRHIINSVNLFQNKYGAEKAHYNAHQAQPFSKSVYSACKKDFAAECDKTARSRFRSIDDILMTVILFPSYALHHKFAILPYKGRRHSQMYMAINDNLEENEVILDKIATRRPKMFCVNDDTSYDNPAVCRQINAFLSGYFPEKSALEY